ncbi:MAG TPA: M13 family metallopeptidase [Myxococcaceae bacterium]|jgi:endothelin-converting enzyme/putative endopeptidase|nr:M13 family metallopeptidase [Myxococcaceae bacterium]
MRRVVVLVVLVAGCAGHEETAPQARRTAVAGAPAGIEASWLDPSVDPCTDFYRFACGGWLANTPPAVEGLVSARFSELQTRTSSTVRGLVEAALGGHPVAGLRPGSPVIDLVASCLDPRVEARGMVELEAELAPLRDAGSPAGIAEVIVRLEARGIPTVLDFAAIPDPGGGPVAVAQIDLRLLGVTRLDPGDVRMPAMREAVRADVQRTFVRGGSPADRARSSADRVMALEDALAATDPGRRARNDPRTSYHRLTREQLETLAPSFPWSRWMRAVGLPPDAPLNVVHPPGVGALEVELRSASPETWRAALEFAVLRWLQAVLPPPEDPAARWNTCLRLASEMMPDALGAPFVARVLRPEDVAAVRLLLGDLEQAFDAHLDALSWMDAPTRAAVRAKLRRLVNRVGRPERWESDQGLVLSRESLVANLLAVSRFELLHEAAQVGHPVDRGMWPVSVLRANAYYNVARNEILVPAALLQPPVFSAQFAPAVNLGLLGTVLGHEIIHGFDRRGRWRDGSGALTSGWTEASIQAFDARSACVRAQADATPVMGGMTVNGAATLDEDVADLGGLRLALLALQDRLRAHPEPPGPGLTPEQQLFLGWGQLWCTKASAETASALLALDVHAPHPVRVNAPLRNLAEFARAFGCRSDAPMVARPRCEVW